MGELLSGTIRGCRHGAQGAPAGYRGRSRGWSRRRRTRRRV